MTDFASWLHDNGDRIYRYWVYKRMFTPKELAEKRDDQTCYECDECLYGRIVEAIALPNGDVLLGFRDPDDKGSLTEGYIDYYRLSEIAFAYSPTDQEIMDSQNALHRI